MRSYWFGNHAGIALVMLLLGLLAAEAGAGARQASQRATEWRAPLDARERQNPLEGRPDTEAGGAKLFGARCVECHGEDARGSRRAPDLTRRAVQAKSDGALFWKITSGNTRAGMPAFSFLPPLQRWQLVQHLRRAATP